MLIQSYPAMSRSLSVIDIDTLAKEVEPRRSNLHSAGMTEPRLPAGYRVSRPTLAAAVDIYDLVAACDTAVLGKPDVTPDDIVDELVEPGFVPGTDGWLVHDPRGRLVGYAWACRKGDSENVDAAVVTPADEDATAAYLWPLVQRRAVTIARELGHRRVVIDAGVYRA